MICSSPGLFLVATAELWEVWHLSPFRWVEMHRGGCVQRLGTERLRGSGSATLRGAQRRDRGGCAPEMAAGNRVLPLVTPAERVCGVGGSRLGREKGAAPSVPGEGWPKGSAQRREAARSGCSFGPASAQLYQQHLHPGRAQPAPALSSGHPWGAAS